MSEAFYELQWNKNGADMTGGTFTSKADALAAIKSVCAEFNSQRTSGVGSGFKVEDFSVHYSGPEFNVSNVELENHTDGYLLAHFDIRQIDSNGDETMARDAEWIDLDDGLLIESGEGSNMTHWSEFSYEDIEEIHGVVNDYLRENPIPEATLQFHRDAKEAQKQELRATL